MTLLGLLLGTQVYERLCGMGVLLVQPKLGSGVVKVPEHVEAAQSQCCCYHVAKCSRRHDCVSSEALPPSSFVIMIRELHRPPSNVPPDLSSVTKMLRRQSLSLCVPLIGVSTPQASAL